METGEKVYASPRPPPKISLKHDWMKELGSEVARQAEGSQPTQSNPNPNHDRTVKPVVCLDENHERPTVVCSEQASYPRFGQNLLFEDEMNHDRTEKPVVSRDANHEPSMLNEVDIDFRIPGLPHSVVKQADNYRVRELVKQIENHPHRQDLQADLQQNNAYNPLSEKSKKMIKDMGNVVLFDLFETEPKTQCKERLLYWSQGIVYCTCGHLLKESEASRGVIQCTWSSSQFKIMSLRRDDFMAIDMGKLQNKESYVAHNLRKRCIKRRLKGIHDRFLKDPEFRESQLEHDRTEEVCIQMAELAQKISRRKQSTFDTERIGGSLSINLEKPDQ